VPSSDLDDTFSQLESRLLDPGGLSASRSDPFFYFVFPPEQALAVKRSLVPWCARLRNAGMDVDRLSLSDVVWELVDAAGTWEEWQAVEPDAEQHEVNQAVSALLRTGGALVERVAAHIAAVRAGTVVFLTEAEMLHPYFRVRTLESALHDRVRVPTVVFYPGRRSGQFGLHFLDFYPEDGNYRATVLGGLA
jgi:Domain of unknown function (DUF1788)